MNKRVNRCNFRSWLKSVVVKIRWRRILGWKLDVISAKNIVEPIEAGANTSVSTSPHDHQEQSVWHQQLQAEKLAGKSYFFLILKWTEPVLPQNCWRWRKEYSTKLVKNPCCTKQESNQLVRMLLVLWYLRRWCSVVGHWLTMVNVFR